MDDGIKLNENKYLLTSLTKACKLVNDRVYTRLPIQKGLLKLLVKQAKIHYRNIGQPYLSILYQALFVTAYFGLLRIGELTRSEHVILAKDVHIGENKNKLLFIQRSSKTHGHGNKPQLVTITAMPKDKSKCKTYQSRHAVDMGADICPFKVISRYVNMRGWASKLDQFFVFADNSPVKPQNLRTQLKTDT